MLKFVKFQKKTIDKIFKAIRIKMAENCEKQAKLSGEIEIDESYFGAKRVRGVGAWILRRINLNAFKGLFNGVVKAF